MLMPLRPLVLLLRWQPSRRPQSPAALSTTTVVRRSPVGARAGGAAMDDETWIDVNQHFYDPSAWRKGRAAVLSDVDLKDGYCKRMNRALQADPEGDLSAYLLFLHASERRA